MSTDVDDVDINVASNDRCPVVNIGGFRFCKGDGRPKYTPMGLRMDAIEIENPHFVSMFSSIAGNNAYSIQGPPEFFEEETPDALPPQPSTSTAAETRETK